MATPSKTAPKADVKGAAVNVKEAEKRNLPQPQAKAQTNDEAAKTLPPTQATVNAGERRGSETASAGKTTSPDALKGEQTLRTRDAEALAASTLEDIKPKETIENEANLELLGNLVRGDGMGVDRATREQLVRSNHATPAETPKVETTVDPDIEKAVKARDEAAEKATKAAEQAEADAAKEAEKAEADEAKESAKNDNK